MANFIRARFPNGYLHCRPIAFNRAMIPADQVQFPVLISGYYPFLATAAKGGLVHSASGFDIAFASDPMGLNPLSWEIDCYGTDGTVSFWVACNLYASYGGLIYMFYGRDGLTASQSIAANVWDANFQGVWHLSDGSTLSYTDSKGVNTGTGVNTPTAAAGKVDGGMQLDGTSQYVNIGHDTSLNVGDVFTVEAWVNTNGGVGTTRCTVFSSRISNTAGSFSCEIGTANSIANSMIMTGIGTYIAQSVGSLVFNSTWYHLVWTKNGSATPVMYVNGAAVTLNSSAAYTVVDNATDKMIGAGAAGGLFLWAIADEVRLSGSVRSANWISTEYNNQSSPSMFYSVLPEITPRSMVRRFGGASGLGFLWQDLRQQSEPVIERPSVVAY